MSSLTFTLPKPRHVYAIRLEYTYLKTASAWPALRTYWRNSALQDFNDRDRWISIVAGPDQPTGRSLTEDRNQCEGARGSVVDNMGGRND